MLAKDVMTTDVVTIAPDASVRDAAALMMQRSISALPVVDGEGRLVGLVSEGDLIRRLEGEDSHGSWWLAMFASTREEAADYVKAHGRHVEDVMTRDVVTVSDDMPVREIAKVLESHRIKRVPVMRDGALVGIVSRANLLHGLAAEGGARDAPPPTADDRELRERVLAALADVPGLQLSWINATVKDGVAELWGIAESEEQERAARVAAENVPGVKRVETHLGRVPAYAWGI